MSYEISERDCPLCNKPTKHFRASAGGSWTCINLDVHDPLHPKSDNWTLLRKLLEDAQAMADVYLAECNVLRQKLADLEAARNVTPQTTEYVASLKMNTILPGDVSQK